MKSQNKMADYGYKIQDITMGRVISDQAARNGEKIFLTWLPDGSTYTYASMHQRSDRIARGLYQMGISHGTHVGIMMDNCPEQVLVYFALGKLGAVAVPINTSSRGKLLARQLEHAELTHVIAEAEFLSRIDEAGTTIDALRTYIVVEQEPSTPALAHSTHAKLFAFHEVEENMDSDSEALVSEVQFSDLAMLSYTSGTTGASKANMFSQAAVVRFGMTTAESYRYSHDDIIYICLPLNHANAYLCALMGAWVANASVTLARRFSVSRFWQDIHTSRATGTSLLGSMVNMIWGRPETPEDANNSLRFSVLTPIPTFVREWSTRFNVQVATSYGLTDYALATIFRPGDRDDKLGSAGRPRPGVEICIADEADVELPSGEIGEILLRTRNPWSGSMGYFKDSATTLAAMRNLWWHTGDRGYLDEDGYLYFADRKKDSIRRRGENISAFEVESIILSHTAVLDAAAYAVPSGQSEDEVAVSVVLREGAQLSARQLVDYCIDNMAHYMVPRFFEFVMDLPRTATQKIQKIELKERAIRNLDAFWDREREGVVVKR